MSEGKQPPEGSSAAPRVSFYTLGCRLNQHDTAAMRAELVAAGYRVVPAGAPADWAVVNTCTVTHRADQEARQLIRRVARADPGVRIAVTGCYAQRDPEALRALPEVSAVLGTAERERIAVHLGSGAAIQVAPGREKRPFRAAAPLSFGRTRALLKVQDGCDSFCAFCIVPFVRGRSRSLPLADAVTQARRLLDAGFHEIVLTGADLGRYGRDLGDRALLPRLIERILALPGRHRVRLSSIEPNKVDRAILNALGREPRLCRHLHLPLQSGSARILEAMRRAYRPSQYLDLCRLAAERGPVGIGADVIVGFPGETDGDFEETERLLEAAPITYLHVFRYSPRPGTVAARRDGAVPPRAARERSERLRALGARKARLFRESLVGTALPVLPEPRAGGGALTAMSDVYVPVRLTGPPRSAGILEAEILGTEGERLIGRGATVR